MLTSYLSKHIYFRYYILWFQIAGKIKSNQSTKNLSKNETRDLPEKLEQTLDEMREDGTSAKIIGKYLDDPEKYLEVDQLEEE